MPINEMFPIVPDTCKIVQVSHGDSLQHPGRKEVRERGKSDDAGAGSDLW